MDNSYYIDMDAWKNYVDDVQDALKTIASDSQCRSVLGDTFCAKARDWNRSITKGRHTPFTVVICGEFKRGKSSLINALLNEEIAPVNVTPETVTVNTICYGTHRNEAVLENGKRLLLSDEDIRREKLTSFNSAHGGKITHLTLYRPIELLRRVNIIDTPGLNESSGVQEELTKKAVSMADAVIYVFVPSSPLSMTEQLFLRTSVLPRPGVDLFLVCNKTDMIEADDQATFRSWMDDRTVDILRGVVPYYVSALDEICLKSGKPRPNSDISGSLAHAMEDLRKNLERTIAERSEMAMPARVEEIIAAMKQDMENELNILEQGATMSEQELEHAEQAVADECLHYETTLSKLVETSGELLEDSMETTADLMRSVVKVMKADTSSLKTIDKEDIIRYYPFYCMDKLQDSMDLCFSHDVSKVTDHLASECGENVAQILDQEVSANLGLSFQIDNQTWTKGDNIGFIGSQFNLGFLSYVIDGVAGSLRNKELKGQTQDVIGQILAQYEGLEKEIMTSVSNSYKKLRSEVSARLQAYYQNKIMDAQERLRKAKEVAVYGSKKKAEICSTANYVRELLQNTLR